MSYLPSATKLKQDNDEYFKQRVFEQINFALYRIISGLFKKQDKPHDFGFGMPKVKPQMGPNRIVIEYKTIRYKWCEDNEEWEEPKYYKSILQQILTVAHFNPSFIEGDGGKSTYWYVIIDNPFYNLISVKSEDLINKTIDTSNHKDIEQLFKSFSSHNSWSSNKSNLENIYLGNNQVPKWFDYFNFEYIYATYLKNMLTSVRKELASKFQNLRPNQKSVECNVPTYFGTVLHIEKNIIEKQPGYKANIRNGTMTITW